LGGGFSLSSRSVGLTPDYYAHVCKKYKWEKSDIHALEMVLDSVEGSGWLWGLRGLRTCDLFPTCPGDAWPNLKTIESHYLLTEVRPAVILYTRWPGGGLRAEDRFQQCPDGGFGWHAGQATGRFRAGANLKVPPSPPSPSNP